MIDLSKLSYFFTNQAKNYFQNTLQIKQEYQKLKNNYSQLKKQNQKIILTSQQKKLYPILRLPNTLAAVKLSLSYISQQLPNFKPTNILDIGSGPGTALFACLEFFSHKFDYLGLEQELDFIAQAQQALKYSAPEILPKINFIHTQAPHKKLDKKFDLVICSYILSEIPPEKLEKLILWASSITSKILLIVDAGTPKIFSHLLKAREILIKSPKTQILAPCPHEYSCPLQNTQDFCHFPARVARTSLVTSVKLATNNYEDEKFCYLGALINPQEKYLVSKFSRIISKPIKKSGHVILDTCDSNGQKTRKIISKKNKIKFREFTKKTWGSLAGDFEPKPD